jgi:GAF domain-containing protein/anti-sigma regulatory factor (Ser/Thr protein kinase)
MKCPQCQQENPPQAKFCLECGVPVNGATARRMSYADLQGENEGLRRSLGEADVQVSEASARETATSDILRVISQSPTDVQPVFDAIVRNAAALCHARDVIILIPDGDSLRAVASIGPVAASVRQSPVLRDGMLPLTRGYVSGRAFIDRITVHVHDVSAASDDDFPLGKALQRAYGGQGTTLAVPLLREAEALGVITLVRNEISPFSERQIELLQTFADQAVIAIENVRLFNELQEKNGALTGAHAQVIESLEQQTATSEILQVISASPTDLRPVFEAILRSATQLCGGFYSLLFLCRGEDLDLTATHNVPTEGIEALKRRYPMSIVSEEAGLTARAVRERRVQHVTDIQTEPSIPEAARRASAAVGQRAGVAIPLLREGQAVGVLTVSRQEARAFSEKELSLLQTFADQAVIAIENVRLFTELETKNARLTDALNRETATAEILKVISGSPTDVQPVLDAVAESAARLCAANDVLIHRVEGGIMRLAAHFGMVPYVAESETRAISPGSHSGRAILERRVIHVHDMLDVRSRADYPDVVKLGRLSGTRTVLAMPLLREGTPIGVIVIRRREVRPFSGEQIELVKTFSDQAVIAIENVRLFTELQEKNRALTQAHAQVTETLEQQTATSEILRVVSQSQTEVQPVFDAILASGVRLCGARFGGVFRFDGDLIHLAASYEWPAEQLEVVRRRFPMPPGDGSLAARAIRDRRVVQTPDYVADSQSGTLPEWVPRGEQRPRSTIAIPMLRDGNPIGAIVLARAEVGFFSDQHIALLETFADQAVIAIENVRLFTELQEKNQALTTAHAQVTESLDQQTATAEILRVISQSPMDVQPVFDAIARSAVRLCEATYGIVHRFDGTNVGQPIAMYNVTDEQMALYRRIFPLAASMETALGESVLTRRTVHVEDTRTERRYTSDSEAIRVTREVLGYRTLLVVPMVHRDQALGIIAVWRRGQRPFLPKQIALVETFADQAVIAIENVRLFTELEEKNRRLTVALDQQTATSEVLRAISSSVIDLQPVFDTIVRNAVKLCAATFGGLQRIVDGRMTLDAQCGVTTDELAVLQRDVFPLPISRGSATGRAVVDRTVVHIRDIREDPEFGVHPLQTMQGFRTILAVPMLREEVPIGALALWRREVLPFSDTEISLVQTFADQAVIAIENVRLFKELDARTQDLTRSVGELRALGEVGQAISSTLDLQTVLSTIVARATQLSGTDAGVIYEYDAQREVFLPRATEHLEAEIVETMLATPVRKGEGATGRLAEVQEAIQVPDILAAPAESRVRGVLVRAGYRALLAAPLIREEQLIGALTVIRKATGEFPPEVIDLLRTFATQSALAIQNARLFREIADKSRQLEVASQHKSEFLANMSHELRTPLNAIIGFSEVLSERMFGELNEKQDEYLKDIHASGQHLLSLINDILDLSKIEAGKMELELSEFDLPMTIDNALMLVRERAGRRSIELQRTVDDRLGQIQGDERKIRQVLLNLLSNAIKFTPEGGRIEVGAKPVNGSIEVSVSDTGVGIAPEDQEAVFEEFRQVGTADKKVEGTGLGLALSRKFIELHGGKIRVKSQVGEGSTFTFTVPVRRGEKY